MFSLEEFILIKNALIQYDIQDKLKRKILDKITILQSEVSKENRSLWNFYWDCGRQGEIEGIFKATREEIGEALNCQVYFGEILGKHSEVFGILETADIELKSDDPIEVVTSEEHGYNPLHYLRYQCSSCGDMTSVNEWNSEKNCCNYCAEVN